jgi:hypothetical protein
MITDGCVLMCVLDPDICPVPNDIYYTYCSRIFELHNFTSYFLHLQ